MVQRAWRVAEHLAKHDVVHGDYPCIEGTPSNAAALGVHPLRQTSAVVAAYGACELDITWRGKHGEREVQLGAN